jgi:metal-responsive CopG/Arc/MetJ family transcriptional regulator
MSTNNPNLTKPTVAADGATNLQRVSVHLSKDMIDHLKRLPGDRSTKIRAAIAEWLEKHSKNT